MNRSVHAVIFLFNTKSPWKILWNRIRYYQQSIFVSLFLPPFFGSQHVHVQMYHDAISLQVQPVNSEALESRRQEITAYSSEFNLHK